AGASFLFVAHKSGLHHVRIDKPARTRRLADLAWRSGKRTGSNAISRPPRLFRYTDIAANQKSIVEQASALVSRGVAAGKDGKGEEAIALFRQALQIRPDHARAHHNFGVALAVAKKHTEALASFRQAIRCQPKYGEAYFALGNTLMEMSRLEEALAA